MSYRTDLINRLRLELIYAYRRDYNDDNPEINWSDALCRKFADYIGNRIEGRFTDEELIRNENKVSETTIQRIVNGQFELKREREMHRTTRRVLDNICMYLDYVSWNEFRNIKEKSIAYITDNGWYQNDDKFTVDKQLEYASYINLVHRAKQAEFDFYKDVRFLFREDLKSYYDEDGEEYRRICKNGERMAMEGLIIDNRRNRSFFSIDAISVVDKTDIKALFTREFWHLEWCDKKIFNCEHYISLFTSQLIYLSTYSDDEGILTYNKIRSIEYHPFCKRDTNYVERVYGEVEPLKDEDMLSQP